MEKKSAFVYYSSASFQYWTFKNLSLLSEFLSEAILGPLSNKFNSNYFVEFTDIKLHSKWSNFSEVILKPFHERI